MIAVMRTKVQAQKVSDLTGGKVLLDDGKPTRKVALAGDFEQYRDALESVSVLFGLCDDTGEKAPTGWTVTGASFELDQLDRACTKSAIPEVYASLELSPHQGATSFFS